MDEYYFIISELSLQRLMLSWYCMSTQLLPSASLPCLHPQSLEAPPLPWLTAHPIGSPTGSNMSFRETLFLCHSVVQRSMCIHSTWDRTRLQNWFQISWKIQHSVSFLNLNRSHWFQMRWTTCGINTIFYMLLTRSETPELSFYI